jgi:hypothetical protein
MLGRVKTWLGIEGVKLELIIPEEITDQDRLIEGKIRFQSLNTQFVTQVKIAFIERFSRGRGDEKLVDEYELGVTTQNVDVEIPAGEIIEVPFTLPISFLRSEMDELEERNLLMGGLVKVAKYFRKVKSEYRLEAEAHVRGVALNPFDKKPILVKG